MTNPIEQCIYTANMSKQRREEYEICINEKYEEHYCERQAD